MGTLVRSAELKKEGLPAESFLVVGDPQKVGTWHLKVRDADGKPDHVLMGNAHAALLSKAGFRGQPYAGPDKEAAIAKLKALYKAEGMVFDESVSMDEPSADDLHIDTTLGTPQNNAPAAPSGHYFARLMASLRDRMAARGMVRKDEFDTMVRAARAHAGGKAHGKAAAEGGVAPVDWQPCDACLGGMDDGCSCPACASGDAADCWCDAALGGEVPPIGTPEGVMRAADPIVSGNGAAFRLFLPCAFTDPASVPDWIPYLPVPGTYTHPTYGEIAISRERNADFVAKFNGGVYQTPVPLDAEHETKLSGAMAWLHELRMNTDGSADARVEWTDRGRQMLVGNRYKFVSPEWYDEWTDPATGAGITNVVIGGAMTTRPYFKSNAQGVALRPLVASEDGLAVPETVGRALAGNVRVIAPGTVMHLVPLARTDAREEQTVATAVQFTEEQASQFAEMKRELDEAKKAVEARETESRQATERIAALEKDKRTQQFTEQARAWYGEIADHVSFLESLTPEQRAFYATQHDAIAAQLKESNLFKEMGRAGAPQSDNPTEKLNAMTTQRAKEQNISFRDAARQIMAEHPDLYEQSKTMNEVHSRGGRKNSAE